MDSQAVDFLVDPQNSWSEPNFDVMSTGDVDGNRPNSSLIRRVFSAFETASSYLLRGVSITKYGLKTHVFSTNKGYDTLLPVSSKLSVFSAINVLLTPWLLFKDAEEGLHSYKKDDSEGVLLAVTSALANCGNGIDQVMTFFSGLNAIDAATPKMGWFATVMPPLGIALTALGIVTESHKMYYTTKIMQDLSQVRDDISMQTFLNNHVGFPGTSDRLRKIALLERRSGLTGIEKMRTFANNSSFIKDATLFQKRKIVHGAINWTTMVVTLVALTLFFTPVSLLVPFAILLGCGVVKLALMIYKQWEMKKGLKLNPSAS